jgi:AcrR family transcriptional regulator
MRMEVAEIAIDLFIERGYENTTVDEICAAASISRSTFFRYFATKEETVLITMEDAADGLLATLRERPDNEPVWEAIAQSTHPLVNAYTTSADTALRSARLVRETPALAGLQRAKISRWASTLRPEIARRLHLDPRDTSDPAPEAVIGAVVVIIDAAVTAWADDNGRVPLQAYIGKAFAPFG